MSKIKCLTSGIAFSLFFLILLPNFFGVHAAGTWYVSKLGNNSNGNSWAEAWNELNQINWSAINPGDTVFIDGGTTACNPPTGNISSDDVAGRTDINNHTCGMRYSSVLTFGKNGASGSPITLKLSQESGRNGTAIFFGGRTQFLPVCGQTNSSNNGIPTDGVITNSHSYITLDGVKWSGIIVYGFAAHGILMNGGDNLTFRNMEIYDNGSITSTGPDQKGIQLSGSNLLFDRILVHDNGQDEFQSGGTTSNFTLKNSWLYNSRLGGGGPFFNSCTHSDGVQIWNGGVQSGFTFDSDVIGPRLMQGLLLGEQSTGSWVNNLTVKNTLIFKTTNANIMPHDYSSVHPQNWNIQNVTSWRDVGANWHNLYYLYGTGLKVSNSLFYGGDAVELNPNDKGTFSNNCYFNLTTDPSFGRNVDPGFKNPTTGDFSLTSSNCAGLGSFITSPSQLLALSDSSGGNPSITPRPASPTPTPNPCALVWDLNCDGKVNTIDLLRLLNIYLSSSAQGDFNHDGKVNIFDAVRLLENWKP